MAAELPYLPSYKNVDKLFSSVATAKQPDAFTHSFLYDTLGLKGTGDRPLIPLLRVLGFLDGSNKPTSEYSELKNPAKARKALGRAVRRAYSPLFDANENANSLSAEETRGLIAQVAGTDAGMTQKISGTFNALVKLADFSERDLAPEEPEQSDESLQKIPEPPKLSGKARPEFHYNIQIHLPPNGDEETYLNIFNAVRKVFV